MIVSAHPGSSPGCEPDRTRERRVSRTTTAIRASNTILFAITALWLAPSVLPGGVPVSDRATAAPREARFLLSRCRGLLRLRGGMPLPHEIPQSEDSESGDAYERDRKARVFQEQFREVPATLSLSLSLSP